ncbi:hypothetical protein BHE74_00052359 [Ensete ventricosum]|nr:hypothetical protein BHE74_00052359 [Ensete ventricosum]
MEPNARIPASANHRSLCCGAIRHKHITHAPNRLDITRLGRIRLDHPAQTGDLHVDGALQGIPFATTGQVHQLVAGQRLACVHHQGLEHREFAGGQHVHFIATLELTSCQRQFVVAKRDALIFAAWRTRHRRRLAAQYCFYARHQLVRVERLGQVVISAQLQALDTAQLIALGGEHDDWNLVVRAAQALAGGQAVFAGQHQVEHDQIEYFTPQQAVHLLGVWHRAGTVALGVEETLQQAAQPRIVINDENFFAFSSLYSAAHWMLLLSRRALWRSCRYTHRVHC